MVKVFIKYEEVTDRVVWLKMFINIQKKPEKLGREC